MKKILALVCVALLSLTVVCSCSPKEKEVSKAEIIAVYEEYVKDMSPTQYEQYGFRDMNSDGVSELLVWRDFILSIYTYKNGEVKEFYQPAHNAMNGPLKILENNAIFIEHDTTGTFYTYTTFNKDGTANEVDFDYGYWSEDDVRYNFEGKSVTKEEWDKLTKKYFEYSEMPEAVIEWKSITQLQNEAVHKAYEDFVVNFGEPGEKVYYLIKDIDGNGVDELLIKDTAIISVYTYDDKVEFVQRKNVTTGNVGTTRFFVSEDKTCPGIFLFGVGGGLEQYNYLTLAGDEVIIEKLWDEDFSDSFNDRERIVEYSKNKALITMSKALYETGKDVVWSEFDASEWETKLKVAYDDAMIKHQSNPQNYRHLGALQPETGEIVEIDGQYYQSYVASNVDMRYIFMKKEECPTEIGGEWDWVPVGTEKTYSLDLIGKIDEGRK